MTPTPVLLLLLLNVILLVVSNPKSSSRENDSLFLGLLFFCSGMPALIYQVVWQRALFAIYGVNSQSVAVVVTAFMLGLGIGSLAGGFVSKRFPTRGILIFGVAELCVAVFGLCSLRIFHWVAGFTAGASLGSVVLFTLLLLLLPTALMGATLPLLVEHLVSRTHRVGASVSTLYFVNTFGSAVACYLCATFLLRDFGQSGSVIVAACINATVGAVSYLYGRTSGRRGKELVVEFDKVEPPRASIPLPLGMMLSGISGFIALGFELAWFRVYSIASADRAPAFALLLSTFLAGIATGSLLSEKLTASMRPTADVQVLTAVLLLAGAVSAAVTPLVATFMYRGIPFLYTAPGFFVAAALIGSVLPLVCRLSVTAGRSAGQGVSLIYVANIVGSAAGSLGIGFLLMNYCSLRQVSLGLSLAAIGFGAFLFIFLKPAPTIPPPWALLLIAGCFVAVLASSTQYSLLFERLTFGKRAEASVPFAHLVENRNGVIGVTQEGAVFGEGVYDGYFNIDPTNDVNLVARAYALSAFCPAPKHILVIGLASASWAQIFANHPQAEALDAVEINPGYLKLIPEYSAVKSFPNNPKVHLYFDDGRRWLLAHPGAHYDAIIANTTFNWRNHTTGLLSVEYLRLIRSHLNPGGVYYFNTTESDETIATALSIFPDALRVINFVAVSDSPLRVDKERWADVLRRYKIDGKTIFDPVNPASEKVLKAYMALADTVNEPPRLLGMEATDSLRARLQNLRVITDDNMGQEWLKEPVVNWH